MYGGACSSPLKGHEYGQMFTKLELLFPYVARVLWDCVVQCVIGLANFPKSGSFMMFPNYVD